MQSPQSSFSTTMGQLQLAAGQNTVRPGQPLTLSLIYTGTSSQVVYLDCQVPTDGIEAVIQPNQAFVTRDQPLNIEARFRRVGQLVFGGSFQVRFTALTSEGLFDSTPVTVQVRPRYEYFLLGLAIALLIICIGLFVVVYPRNTDPRATDDADLIASGETLSVSRGRDLTIPAPGILQNDEDPDEDDEVSISAFTQPLHGQVIVSPDGSFVYTHNGDEVTVDSFTYTIEDKSGATDTATVRINIKPDEAPLAQNDALTIEQGRTVTIPAPGVLGNDSDPENDELKVVSSSQPTHGTVTVNPDGSYVYIHQGGAEAAQTDSFTYTVADRFNETTATVNINIFIHTPTPTATPYCAPSCNYYGWDLYMVDFGDTLSSLAFRRGYNPDFVAQVNCLANPSLIYVGQLVCLPPLILPPPPYTGYIGSRPFSPDVAHSRGKSLFASTLVISAMLVLVIRARKMPPISMKNDK